MSVQVSLERNMTEKRLPDEIKGAESIRIVVFEFDKECGAKSVYDIIQMPAKWSISYFNNNRKYYLEKGCEVLFEKIGE